MSQPEDIGLPEALERAAAALPADADTIRPANGDPFALLSLLDGEASKRVLEWLLTHEPIAGGEIVNAWTDAGGEATDDQDLSAQREKDPKVAVDVRVAVDRRGVQVIRIEPRRLLRLRRVDVNMIE